MKKNQVHPAAIRSKNLLVESLLNLMTDISYEKITIKDIAESALLTRRTFYAHFKTKEDVLQYRLSMLNSQLISQISDLDGDSLKLMAYAYFDFWMKQKKLLTLMKKHKLLPLLFDNFDSMIGEVRSILGCRLAADNNQYGAYSSAYFTGVLSSMLYEWIERGAKETPSEMLEMLTLITGKMTNTFI